MNDLFSNGNETNATLIYEIYLADTISRRQIITSPFHTLQKFFVQPQSDWTLFLQSTIEQANCHSFQDRKAILFQARSQFPPLINHEPNSMVYRQISSTRIAVIYNNSAIAFFLDNSRNRRAFYGPKSYVDPSSIRVPEIARLSRTCKQKQLLNEIC